ncbi:porin [Shimia abyssi]|uniref:Outer membrane protein OmpU n=1 Tax=Shimia abyssi TaxID=1662395 RepID=A0A2P8FHW8_9RHOB|nr:porin [Shimia abyssi]PSL21314.1 outer membrane protein OmpU [Shimia abyssi]
MKKILFASTALIATAGMAAAEITWGGYGRFGLVYDADGANSNTHESALDHRFRLTVTGISETDNGLKFEGRIRWEANDGGFSSNAANAASVGGAGFAVTTGGFRLDVGHVSDVFDSGDVLNWGGHGAGYTYFQEQSSNFNGFRKTGFGAGAAAAQTIKGRYTVSGFTGSISYTLNDTASTTDEYWQIGAGYSFGDHRVGAAYGDSDIAGSQWALGVDGSFGDFSYAVLVGDNDTAADTMFGASGSYAISAATSINANFSSGGAAGNDTSYGLGVRHSLGGGVTLGAGIGSASDGDTVADAGVQFNF